MSVFDLLFLALVAASVMILAYALICAVIGQRGRALRVLRGCFLVAAIYLVAVIVVSLFTMQRVVAIGEPLCFDDWCITVVSVEPLPSASKTTYTVNLQLSSRARRIIQRENNLALYVTDSRGLRQDPERRSSDVPLNTQLGPGESVSAARVFHVSRDASDLSLVIAHEGCFPIEWFIIGGGPFKLPPIVRLPQPASIPSTSFKFPTSESSAAE